MEQEMELEEAQYQEEQLQRLEEEDQELKERKLQEMRDREKEAEKQKMTSVLKSGLPRPNVIN